MTELHELVRQATEFEPLSMPGSPVLRVLLTISFARVLLCEVQSNNSRSVGGVNHNRVECSKYSPTNGYNDRTSIRLAINSTLAHAHGNRAG